ncbi:MAG: ATP-NAD kinase, partial [Candidatus Heimdallarchaeota archaeon]
RGSKQINMHLLEQLEKSDIKIFSTPAKLRETPQLYLDTGSIKLNNKYKGYYHIITGYHEEVIRKAI